VLLTLVAGPQLWVVALYVASAVSLLWSKPARAWFTVPADAGGGPGVPPTATGPSPPPPPPPRPR